MLTPLKDCLKDLLTTPCCPLCRRDVERGLRRGPFCLACWQRMDLPERGLHGLLPCRWAAAGWYDGELRRLILHLRHHPDPRLLDALTGGLAAALSDHAVLIPIPGWKAESRSNPLPRMVCRSLQRTTRSLLERSRPTVGQHHLRRPQRLTNQQGSFVVTPEALLPKAFQESGGRVPELWLVDDILTSGATTGAAMDALSERGLTIRGVICLGRTPLARTR